MQPQSILRFWFNELTPKHHLAKDAHLDETIRTHFGATLAAAARCELFAWRATPEGRLAEVLVLDQFSRNVYRDPKLSPCLRGWVTKTLCALSSATKPSPCASAATPTATPSSAARPRLRSWRF